MLDKHKIKHRFSQALNTYDGQAQIQKYAIGQLLQAQAQWIPADQWQSVLEIGCGTGALSKKISQFSQLKKLYINDLYQDETLQQWLTTRSSAQVEWLVGDIEQQTMPQHLDVVVSSSALQWMSNLPQLLSNIHQALNTVGYFAFSTFGPKNLIEIKTLTRQGLNYYSLAELEQLLITQGFEVLLLQEHMKHMWFLHPREILQHLKETGVTATGQFRWTKTALMQFYQDYIQFKDPEHHYPLTYHPIICIARKRHV